MPIWYTVTQKGGVISVSARHRLAWLIIGSKNTVPLFCVEGFSTSVLPMAALGSGGNAQEERVRLCPMANDLYLFLQAVGASEAKERR